jgi:hypothetical protein
MLGGKSLIAWQGHIRIFEMGVFPSADRSLDDVSLICTAEGPSEQIRICAGALLKSACSTV